MMELYQRRWGAGGGAGVPVVAVVGDLSFFHDITGLLMTRNSEINATIVVVNNDGGGIFSFLPQAEHPAHFEKVYGTPHGLTFGVSGGVVWVGVHAGLDVGGI